MYFLKIIKIIFKGYLNILRFFKKLFLLKFIYFSEKNSFSKKVSVKIYKFFTKFFSLGYIFFLEILIFYVFFKNY